ncbi:hypothetical protein E3Q16_02462 [Wallemia mellicola]|nr:hypothetical protein E3Q16_02462 [Wallemia mellicola]TIC22846.1 hypothetical protein E3Q12_02409 [Wallemia mellicola]TIC54933.1 hypothetical protein E3Q04_02121 [Wallemia mellicola]
MSCVESYVETLSNALSTDEIVALQQKLEADIDSRRLRLAERLNRDKSVHAHQLSQSLSLVQMHSQLSSQSEEISKKIEQTKPTLRTEIEAYESHIYDYNQAKLEHEAKSILDSVQLSLSTFRQYIDTEDLVKAAKFMQDGLKNTFQKLSNSFVARWSGSAALQTECGRLSELLTEKLTKAWNDSVECTQTTLTLRASNGSTPLSETVEALEVLNMSTRRFTNLYNNIKTHFVDILLPSPTNQGLVPTLVANEDTLTLKKTQEAPIKSTQLDSLSTLLHFVDSRYKELGEQLRPVIIERLMEHYLLPSLPVRLGGPDITLFVKRLEEAVAFEKDILSCSQQDTINQFARVWGDSWLQKRRNQVLSNTRSVIVRPDWDTFVAEIEVLVEDSKENVKRDTPAIQPPVEKATDDKEAKDLHQSESKTSITSAMDVDNNNNDDDDGWGLDDDDEGNNVTAALNNVDSKTSIVSMREAAQDDDMEDGWGLEDNEDVEKLKNDDVNDLKVEKPDLSRISSQSSITSPQPDVIEEDDDGWGLDDDEEHIDEDKEEQIGHVQQIDDDDDPWKEDMDEPAARKHDETGNDKVEQDNNQLMHDDDDPWKEDMTDVATKDNASEDGWGLDDDEVIKHEEVAKVDTPIHQSGNVTHDKSEMLDTQKSVEVAPTRQELKSRSLVASQYVKQILLHIDDALNDRQYLLQTNEIPSKDNNLPEKATEVAELVLDFYRSLFPYVHRETIKLVPALALQFSNDCEYLSHEVSDRELKTSSKKLELLKQTTLVNVDVEQRRQIVDILTDAGPLTDLSINHERAFAGVISSFSRLRSSVKDVIDKEELNKLLGSVAEFLMRFVIEAVEDMDDISEEDSQKLCKMCRDLQAGLQCVFEENGTEGFKQTDNWFKFAYLSEILQASLVDLSYLHKEGSLVDFSSEELVRLCKALFADTEKRAQVIDDLMVASAR